MAPTKTALTANANVLGTSALNSKSITGVDVYRHGSVVVIEISFSGGSQFIKVKNMLVEIGGTNEWDTGTKV